MGNKIIVLKFLIAFFIVSSCGLNKTEKTKELHKELSYAKLDNNKDASLEILNQLRFLEQQLIRKQNNKPYVSTNAKNISILSRIPANIEGTGYLGNTFELSQKLIDKWNLWYKQYSKYIAYEIIDNQKHFIVNYPNGEKVILKFDD